MYSYAFVSNALNRMKDALMFAVKLDFWFFSFWKNRKEILSLSLSLSRLLKNMLLYIKLGYKIPR